MVPQLTYRNHFKFGYKGKDWFSLRTSHADQWVVKYGRSEREPLDFRAECIRTATLIRQINDAPITVLFSGGVDSEIVVRSFMEAGIAIRCAINRYADGLNRHDIEWALDFCDIHGLPYDVYDLDLMKFWAGPIYDYCHWSQSLSPQLAPQMWLADQVEGIPVMGSGECLMVKERPLMYVPGTSPYEHSQWFLSERERIAPWYRHFLARFRQAVPGFFQYTPEIIHSFLADDMVRDLCNSQINGKLSSMSSKLAIYKRYWPELEDRDKYTGFEMVQQEDKVLRERLMALWGHCDGVHLTRYEDALCMTSYRK